MPGLKWIGSPTMMACKECLTRNGAIVMSPSSPADNAVSVDTGLVRRVFERIAPDYQSADAPDQEIGRRLLEHLVPVRIEPSVILDIGTGTGGCARRLLKAYRKARIVALDVAPAMLRISRRQEPRFFSRQRFVCADTHQLGIATSRADLVYSNLTLPWCTDLDRVFREMRRVLKPGGLLALSTLGPDTLRELRACWRQIDDLEHVHGFIDMHDIGDALVRAGFVDVVMDTEIITLRYREIDGLLADLKQLGTGNLAAGRRRTLTGRARLARLRDLYRDTGDGAIDATLEVTYAHAWSAPQKGSTIPLVDLG